MTSDIERCEMCGKAIGEPGLYCDECEDIIDRERAKEFQAKGDVK